MEPGHFIPGDEVLPLLLVVVEVDTVRLARPTRTAVDRLPGTHYTGSGCAVKRFRSFAELLPEIESLLSAAQPSFHHSPLEDVVQTLSDGRHYAWMGIYLAIPAPAPQPLLEAGADAAAEKAISSRSRVLVTMTLGSREIGVIDVESNRPGAFSSAEVVFLEQVAEVLARYLAGPGRFLVRRARQNATGEARLARGTTA